MAKRSKSRREIANSFWVSVADICKLFGCGKILGQNLFNAAKQLDKEEITDGCTRPTIVRLSSVLAVAGIPAEELKEKLQSSETD